MPEEGTVMFRANEFGCKEVEVSIMSDNVCGAANFITLKAEKVSGAIGTMDFTDTTEASVLKQDNDGAEISILDAHARPGGMIVFEVAVEGKRGSICPMDIVVPVRISGSSTAEAGKDFVVPKNLKCTVPAKSTSCFIGIQTDKKSKDTEIVLGIDTDKFIDANPGFDHADLQIEPAVGLILEKPVVTLSEKVSATEGESAKFTVSIPHAIDEDIDIDLELDVEDKLMELEVDDVTIEAGETSATFYVEMSKDDKIRNDVVGVVSMKHVSTKEYETSKATGSAIRIDTTTKTVVISTPERTREGKNAEVYISLPNEVGEDIVVQWETNGKKRASTDGVVMFKAGGSLTTLVSVPTTEMNGVNSEEELSFEITATMGEISVTETIVVVDSKSTNLPPLATAFACNGHVIPEDDWSMDEASMRVYAQSTFVVKQSLLTCFVDPENEPLTYTVKTEGDISVDILGSEMMVTADAGAFGSTQVVTITATDMFGEQASIELTLEAKVPISNIKQSQSKLADDGCTITLGASCIRQVSGVSSDFTEKCKAGSKPNSDCCFTASGAETGVDSLVCAVFEPTVKADSVDAVDIVLHGTAPGTSRVCLGGSANYDEEFDSQHCFDVEVIEPMTLFGVSSKAAAVDDKDVEVSIKFMHGGSSTSDIDIMVMDHDGNTFEVTRSSSKTVSFEPKVSGAHFMFARKGTDLTDSEAYVSAPHAFEVEVVDECE
jgi:hypothetical protein